MQQSHTSVIIIETSCSEISNSPDATPKPVHSKMSENRFNSNFTPAPPLQDSVKLASTVSRDSSFGKNILNENPLSRPSKRTRLPDFCFYCEILVFNFARHIFRNHIAELEVQKILSTPKNSKERKRFITDLRKKGNFIQNANHCIKPMKLNKLSEYLPCTHCLGFYSRKQLWKHRKSCTKDSNNSNVQSEAQGLLTRHLKVDKMLKETVFPRMRADKLSIVAKSDLLICAFGARYLKIHREKHFVNVTSRK